MKRIYLVIHDTMKHGQVAKYCHIVEKHPDGTVRIETDEGFFWANKTDLVDVTAPILYDKQMTVFLWIAAILSFTVMVANIYNGGQWYATVGFAIISLGLFTYIKIKKTEL